MALSFPTAPRVAKGSKVTSTQLAGLVDAFNARLRAGLGDPTWRIFFYWLSAFRQIRNSNAAGNLFPPLAEFFEIYQHLVPAEARWPLTGPGDPEGTNVASFMGAFVFGAAAINLDEEDVRLTDETAGGIPLWPGAQQPTTPALVWQLGKLQRGAYDPVTGVVGSPSFTAARQHYKLFAGRFSPHGNSWGGYLPLPTVLGDCADGTALIAPTINYEIFFTKLDPSAACPANTTTSGLKCIYPGTCPLTNGHVRGIASVPGSHYAVYRVGGVVDILPANQFVLGPFTQGAQLRKEPSNIIPRILARFGNEFRGSDAQREPENYEVKTNGFPNQRFLASQYFLAPAIGSEMGGEVLAEYPNFSFKGAATIGRGTLGRYDRQSSDRRMCDPSAKVAAYYMQAKKLFAPVTLELLDAGKVFAASTITPDQNGDVSLLVTLTTARRPVPLQVRLANDARFTDASGEINVEFAELYDYKPQEHDRYLVLRCASGIIAEPDGRGIDDAEAKEIGDDYFANGAIINRRGHAGLNGQLVSVNQNAVFDSSRRWSKMVRCLPGTMLVGYEVSGGKSICYFRRYAYGLNGEIAADAFDGIAPARAEAGQGGIKWGRTYTVRTGSAVYDGQTYSTGQTFKGVRGKTSVEGTGSRVFEQDGIYATASEQDFSNEWLMGAQFKVYHWSISSIWKPDAYSKYFALSNRCHFRSPSAEGQPDLVGHFSNRDPVLSGQGYGNKLLIAPEAPSGYNYVHGTNAGNADHYKSCRIYEPDPEIESATILIENGEEIVKLTFKTRFHAHSAAPATVSRDMSGWDWTALAAEGYRTMENGIREFLGNQFQGRHCTRGATAAGAGQEGNSGWVSPVWNEADNPYGACWPHFLFTKLIPKPYRETPDNDTLETHDTKTFHDTLAQAELYLRAMCEGALDVANTEAVSCTWATEGLIDYTFENLMFDASGQTMQWISLLPAVLRSDKPQGFGPPPNTDMHAETFNLFAAAVDLLNKFRVMLPVKAECRQIHYTGDKTVAALDSDGTPGVCSVVSNLDVYHEGQPPPGSTLTSTDAWADCTASTATFGASLSNSSCDGSNFVLHTTRTDAEFRIALSNADALNAIPPAWSDMVSTQFGMVVKHCYSYGTISKAVTLVRAEAQGCGAVPDGWWQIDGSHWWKWVIGGSLNPAGCGSPPFPVICKVLKSAVITADALGSNVFPLGRQAGSNCGIGTQNDITLGFVATNETAFVEIPLV